MIKTAADLFAAGALRTEEVDVCGVKVTVHELSVTQRARFVEESSSNPMGMATLLVQMCAIKPDGSALLTSEEAAKLGELSPALVDGISAAVLKLSGLAEKPPKD